MENDYQGIFQDAVGNTLQLASCRFYAYIVSEDGDATDVTEIRGDYVGGLGVFKHEKATSYEADWLMRVDGSFIKYTGKNSYLLPGSNLQAQEPNYKLPALWSIPVFEDLANMSTNFTEVKLQTGDNRTFYQFIFIDSVENQYMLSRSFFIALDAPEYIMRMDEADYLYISGDASIVTAELWPPTLSPTRTQSPISTSNNGPRAIGTTGVVTLSDFNDPLIILPSSLP